MIVNINTDNKYQYFTQINLTVDNVKDLEVVKCQRFKFVMKSRNFVSNDSYQIM